MMIDFALEAERTEGKAPRRRSTRPACSVPPIMMTTLAPVRRPPLAIGAGVGESSASARHRHRRRLILSQLLTLYTTPSSTSISIASVSVRALARAVAAGAGAAVDRTGAIDRHVGLSATERRAQAGDGGSSSSKNPRARST